MKTVNQILLGLLQIGFYAGTFVGAALLEVHNNRLEWNPRFDFMTLAYFFVPILFCVFIYIITPKLNRLFCMVLNAFQLAFVIYWAGQVLTNRNLISGFLGRESYGPLWFKLLIIFLVMLPLLVSSRRLIK